jgi:hypothetical protein
MSSNYNISISQHFTGLCNQLLTLVGAMCYCYGHETIIVVDKFLLEAYTDNFFPISTVINLEQTNKYLEKYNIAIVDGLFLFDFNIVSAQYGCDDYFIDVTDIIRTFLSYNSFTLRKDVYLHHLFPDPQPGRGKFLKINFILNNYNRFTMKYGEFNGFLHKDIDINLNNVNFNFVSNWNLPDLPQFSNMTTDIYRHIFFNDILVNASNNFINSIGVNGQRNVNVIHLRLEDDAKQFWGKSNDGYDLILSDKYIELIQNHISKDDITIILTYKPNNYVTDYLRNNNYNYHVCEKHMNNNREWNAIIDYLNSKHCNNVFIANIGSTFSCLIGKIMNPKGILYVDIQSII